MLLPLTVSCFSKIQIGLPFWYRLTWVVPDKGPLNGCVCVINVAYSVIQWTGHANITARLVATMEHISATLFAKTTTLSTSRNDNNSQHMR